MSVSIVCVGVLFFFSSRRRHTRWPRDWSSDVCSSDLEADVLFTDIDLGAGMDGAQLAQLVHEMRPKLPIVYASGRRSLDQFKAVPGSVFLPKPYSLNQVDQTLARIKGPA